MAFTDWFKVLDLYTVEYVLVGGYGGVLHGATRPTYDLDVVPAWTEENLQLLCNALRAHGAESTSGPRVAGDAITPAVLVDREVMTWQTDLGRLDTLYGIPDSEGMPVAFNQLLERSPRYELDGVSFSVASLDDIITSKEFAGRRKDAEALPQLRRLRDQAASNAGTGTEPGSE